MSNNFNNTGIEYKFKKSKNIELVSIQLIIRQCLFFKHLIIFLSVKHE